MEKIDEYGLLIIELQANIERIFPPSYVSIQLQLELDNSIIEGTPIAATEFHRLRAEELLLLITTLEDKKDVQTNTSNSGQKHFCQIRDAVREYRAGNQGATEFIHLANARMVSPREYDLRTFRVAISRILSLSLKPGYIDSSTSQ